jgi:hypothetical protein
MQQPATQPLDVPPEGDGYDDDEHNNKDSFPYSPISPPPNASNPWVDIARTLFETLLPLTLLSQTDRQRRMIIENIGNCGLSYSTPRPGRHPCRRQACSAICGNQTRCAA